MARVVDDGRICALPSSRGATENLNFVYLRGVDTAIINSDALEEYKILVPESESDPHLLNLFRQTAHLCSARDREPGGSRWQERNFNTQGRLPPIQGR
jgi:hypothetical protein